MPGPIYHPLGYEYSVDLTCEAGDSAVSPAKPALKQVRVARTRVVTEAFSGTIRSQTGSGLLEYDGHAEWTHHFSFDSAEPVVRSVAVGVNGVTAPLDAQESIRTWVQSTSSSGGMPVAGKAAEFIVNLVDDVPA